MSYINSDLFQKEVLSLILKNAKFTNRFVNIVNADENLKKSGFKFFANRLIAKIVATKYEISKKTNVSIVSRGLIENELRSANIPGPELTKILSILEECFDKIHITDFRGHETAVQDMLEYAITSDFVTGNIELLTSGDSNDTKTFSTNAKGYLKRIGKITANKTNFIDVSDPLRVIKDFNSIENKNVPIGCRNIDERLNGGGENGGLRRKELAVFMARVNAGKSYFLATTVSNALRAEFGVLSINCEGHDLQFPFRMISNFSTIPSSVLAGYGNRLVRNPNLELMEYLENSNISKHQLQGLDKYKKCVANDRFRYVHTPKDTSIEYIYQLAVEAYAEKPFDLLTIDYIQKMKSHLPFASRELMLGYIAEQLEVLASELNIVVLTPAQVNRNAMMEMKLEEQQGNQYPMYGLEHIADSKKLIDQAGTVLAYTRTKQEMDRGCGRIGIVKQRDGKVGYQIGIKGAFYRANIFDGDIYYESESDDDGKITSTMQSGARDVLSELTKQFKPIVAKNKIDNDMAIGAYQSLEILFKMKSKIDGISKNGISPDDERYLEQSFIAKINNLKGDRYEIEDEINSAIDKIISHYREILKEININPSTKLLLSLGDIKVDDGRSLGIIVQQLSDKITPFLREADGSIEGTVA